jgi:Transglutaminase-like superfamily
MSEGTAVRTVQMASAVGEDSLRQADGVDAPHSAARLQDRHTFFRMLWYAGNILLILAILVAVYSAVWEYSTRRYLRGFSDAIVPESSSTEQKVEAILQWMSHGPARQETGPPAPGPDRNPTDTLNYASLLRVCGSATNAFVNLADSAGLPSRRLLLLDSHRMTEHVVAEVFVDGRWAVVDPAFRAIFRGADGHLLTREELANPAVLAAATQGIAGYDPAYRFDRTAHVRIARLRFIGLPIRSILNRLLPGWEDSVAVSLMLERESLATFVISFVFVLLLGCFRAGMRWFGENRLGVRPVRFRQQVRRAFQAFVDTAG